MQLFQFQLQSTDTDGRSQALCLFIRVHGRDLCITVGEYTFYGRNTYKGSIIIDTQGLALLVSISGSLFKLFSTFLRHYQVYRIGGIAHRLILDRACGSSLDIGTLQHDGSICLQFIDGLVQSVRIAYIALCIGHCLHRVIRIAVLVCLCNEIQGTGTSQFFQDLVGICYTGDLDVDTIGTLLVYNSLFTVVLNTLLQLGNSICHIRCIRLFIAYHLISDADTTGQIQSQTDV